MFGILQSCLCFFLNNAVFQSFETADLTLKTRTDKCNSRLCMKRPIPVDRCDISPSTSLRRVACQRKTQSKTVTVKSFISSIQLQNFTQPIIEFFISQFYSIKNASDLCHVAKIIIFRFFEKLWKFFSQQVIDPKCWQWRRVYVLPTASIFCYDAIRHWSQSAVAS